MLPLARLLGDKSRRTSVRSSGPTVTRSLSSDGLNVRHGTIPSALDWAFVGVWEVGTTKIFLKKAG